MMLSEQAVILVRKKAISARKTTTKTHRNTIKIRVFLLYIAFFHTSRLACKPRA